MDRRKRKGRATVQINVEITRDQKRALEAERHRTGTPAAAVIRGLIDNWIREQEAIAKATKRGHLTPIQAAHADLEEQLATVAFVRDQIADIRAVLEERAEKLEAGRG